MTDEKIQDSTTLVILPAGTTAHLKGGNFIQIKRNLISDRGEVSYVAEDLRGFIRVVTPNDIERVINCPKPPTRLVYTIPSEDQSKPGSGFQELAIAFVKGLGVGVVYASLGILAYQAWLVLVSFVRS